MRLGRKFFIFIVMASLLTGVTADAATASSSKTKKSRPTVTRTVKKTTTTTTTTKTLSPALTVENVRAGHSNGKTRLVIEFSKPADYRVFTMNKPWRLVVDVPPARWKAPKSDAPRGAPLLKQYRSGTLNDGLTRIVFDLAQPASVINAFMLPKDKGGRDRLVLDLQIVSQQLFDQQEKQISGNANIRTELTAKTNAALAQMPKMSEQMAGIETTPIAPAVIETTTIEGATVPMPAPKPSFGADSNETILVQTPNKPAQKKKYTVVVDAGHGGDDPGALGDNGVREKNITLAVARELREQLLQTGRYNVVLTRDRDVYIKLHERVAISREKGGDVFVSIHADKAGRDAVRGASIYTLSDTASDAETARLADQENNAGKIAGVDLSGESHDVANILLDLAMREKMNESNLLAGIMQDALEKENIRLLPNSHRSAGFAVLKAPDVPSILIETGFLSNREEAKLLSSGPFQAKIARAVAEGIDAYFRKIEALKGE